MADASGEMILFRADASRAIGGGHVVRCLALAEPLMARGARCAFATSAESRGTVPGLDRFGGPLVELPDGAGASSEAEAMARRFPAGVDWLIVDHYARDAAFERSCRPWAKHMLVIDDLADRQHDCDILLDQTSTERAADYRSLVPPGCRLLAGPAYALLRLQFASHRRRRPREAAQSVSRVFVSFGAVDAHDHCSMALAALAEAGLGARVDVVVGRTAPHRSNVERQAAALPFPVEVHSDVDDMAGLMASADLAIGAAGVTSWERCALGLPSIVIVAAENQRLVAAELHQRGAALVLGEAGSVAPPQIAEAFRSLASDRDRRAAMMTAARSTCDGLGANRVGAALLPALLGADGGTVDLRPATIDDAALLLRWQSDPNTRRFARNRAVPDGATHEAWMRARLGDPECLLSIVLSNGMPAGALRLDRAASAGDTESWEISIYVDPTRYRQGIAKAALALARRLLPDAVFLADILPENAASHGLFAGAGYVLRGARYEQRPAARRKTSNQAVAS